MTTDRLLACVRTNADYRVAELLARDLGLSLAVEPAPGRGHPRAVFTAPDGRVTTVPLCSSPGRVHPAQVRSRMLRRMRERGFLGEEG